MVEFRHRQFMLEYNPPTAMTTVREPMIGSSDKPVNGTNDYEPQAFPIHSRRPKPDSLATAELWHRRMGHPGPDIIENLTQAVHGAKIRGPSTAECEICAVTKAHQIISRHLTTRSTTLYERVHFDLVYHKEAYNAHRYMLHFYEESVHTHYVYTLARKKQIVSTIKGFVAYVERQYSCKVRIFRTDGETALGNYYDTWVLDEGIRIEPSPPYTKEQNGAAERSGGVITVRARALRIGSKLPATLWPEITKCAAYLLNRSPCKYLQWKTPLEVHDRALGIENPAIPNVAHLRAYGCRAYVRIPTEKIQRTDKLAPRAHIGYLVRYESTNIFRI